MAHANELFPGLTGSDEVELKFCDIEFKGDEATITKIWRRSTTEVQDIPSSEVVERALQPGQAVIAGDVLYAFVRPRETTKDHGPESTQDATKAASSAPSETVSPEKEPAASAPESSVPAGEATKPASAVEVPRARQPVDPDAALDESVSLAERLTRLSLMLCDQQERYMQQHVERVRRFDEYVQERERKLDVRCDNLAAAQERHLETLRSITADVTASVKLVSRQQFPTTSELPEDYTQARARLAASAYRPVDLRTVAYQVGSFLSEAQSFFSGAPGSSNGGYP